MTPEFNDQELKFIYEVFRNDLDQQAYNSNYLSEYAEKIIRSVCHKIAEYQDQETEAPF